MNGMLDDVEVAVLSRTQHSKDGFVEAAGKAMLMGFNVDWEAWKHASDSAWTMRLPRSQDPDSLLMLEDVAELAVKRTLAQSTKIVAAFRQRPVDGPWR